jgi:multisubunit Na+/H+ antiporter MnhB subunit
MGGAIFTTLIITLIFVFNPYRVKPSRRNWHKTKKLMHLGYGTVLTITMGKAFSSPTSFSSPKPPFLLKPTHSENTTKEKLYGPFSISF